MELLAIVVMAAFLFLLGMGQGEEMGIQQGAKMLYTGKMQCETLLDGAIRCVDTTKVKGK